MVQVRAPAKINLCLEVLGRRPDGYHEVATVLHTICLTDELSFAPADALSLDCQPEVGSAEDNLALRAARLLKEATGCQKGAAITLRKHIPAAAGLGGGSSDAAATLKALDKLWGLGLSREGLVELAARLGSDVPFFLDGGCALAQGRGEMLTPLLTLQGWWAVLLCPPLALEGKTGRLYGMLTPEDYDDRTATEGLVLKIQRGTAAAEEFALAGNTFERVADVAFPGLADYRQAFLGAGAPFVRLSGSGPTLFTLTQGFEHGGRMGEALRRKGYTAFLAALE